MTMKATSNQYTKITLFLNVFLNSFPKNFAVIHVLRHCPYHPLTATTATPSTTTSPRTPVRISEGTRKGSYPPTPFYPTPHPISQGAPTSLSGPIREVEREVDAAQARAQKNKSSPLEVLFDVSS